MNILNFIKKLVPFPRDQVLEDCRITRTEISEFTAPLYNQGREQFAGSKFKSETIKDLNASFQRLFKTERNDNMVVAISKVWPDALKNLDHMADLVRTTFNDDVAGAGLTYTKANVLQFVEFSSFASRYARALLNLVYVEESAQHEDSGVDLAESITKAERDWLHLHFVNFCSVLSVVASKPEMVEKTLRELPDIQVTADNAATLSHTLSGGEAALDPFNMRLVPVALNPIYHIRMRVAEWQVNRYNEAKDEMAMLELRRLNLKKMEDGKPDAALQKKISYLEERVNKQKFHIAQMEAKLNV